MTTTTESLIFVGLLGLCYLCTWFGITLERDRQKFIKQTQYKLDNERNKRGN